LADAIWFTCEIMEGDSALVEATQTDRFEVVVAGYPDRERAKSDFDEVVRRIESGAVRSEGVIVVDKDEAGDVHVARPGVRIRHNG
jgi:hypothetical protein